MKVAFCIYKFFPHGGLQQNFLKIVRACQARHLQVVAYALEWEPPLPDLLDVRVVPVRSFENHRRYQKFTAALQERLQADPVDALIGFNKMPNLDIYYAGDACFAEKAARRSWWYRQLPRTKHYLRYEAAVFAKGLPTRILSLSSQQQAIFQRFFQTEENRFVAIPPGIAADRRATDDAQAVRCQWRKRFAVDDDDQVLLLIGSGFRVKGVDRALRAFASLSAEVRERSWMFVVGHGDEHPYLRLSKQLSIEDRVRFVGGRADIPDFLQGADVLIHPASRENTGNVLLEAVVAGLPVLTTANCGYANYVIQADCGVVLPEPFQQSELNQALQRMLESPQRSHWRQQGIRFGQTQDLYGRAERVAEFIVEHLQQKGAGSVSTC